MAWRCTIARMVHLRFEYQQQVYYSDYDTCTLLANNETGSDFDDSDASLNNDDVDEDGLTTVRVTATTDAMLNTYDEDGMVNEL